MLYRMKELRFVYTGFTKHLHKYIDLTKHGGRTFNITSVVNFKNNFIYNIVILCNILYLVYMSTVLSNNVTTWSSCNFLEIHSRRCSMRRVECCYVILMLVSRALHHHIFKRHSILTTVKCLTSSLKFTSKTS